METLEDLIPLLELPLSWTVFDPGGAPLLLLSLSLSHDTTSTGRGSKGPRLLEGDDDREDGPGDDTDDTLLLAVRELDRGLPLVGDLVGDVLVEVPTEIPEDPVPFLEPALDPEDVALDVPELVVQVQVLELAEVQVVHLTESSELQKYVSYKSNQAECWKQQHYRLMFVWQRYFLRNQRVDWHSDGLPHRR